MEDGYYGVEENVDNNLEFGRRFAEGLESFELIKAGEMKKDDADNNLKKENSIITYEEAKKQLNACIGDGERLEELEGEGKKKKEEDEKKDKKRKAKEKKAEESEE